MWAGLEGEAKARVYGRVQPSVAVGVLNASISLGAVETGDFSGIIGFRIESNADCIGIWAAASNLYKGGNPLDPEVAPLPVLQSEGIWIDPVSAAPLNGAARKADYTGAAQINGFAGYITGRIDFESSQIARFSQDVYLTVHWTQPDAAKPRGQYSGQVAIYCLIVR